MTRREKIVAELGLNEIVQESIKRHPRFADKRVGFIDGAEWMQKKMVEKACEWLDEHWNDYFSENDDFNGWNMISDFRKAMEE